MAEIVADINASQATDLPLTDAETAVGGAGGGGAKKRKLGLSFWLPAAWILVVLISAVAGPILPGLQDPNKPDPCTQYSADIVDLGLNSGLTGTGGEINGVDTSKCGPQSKPGASPSSKHLLGLDSAGRDVLARLVAGARIAMIVGLLTIGIAVLVGGTIGLIAGFYGKRTEVVLMAGVDIMLAFPVLVLALAIVAILQPGLKTTCIAITIVAIPAFARIARANTLTYSQREFVTAARLIGAKNQRILRREVLPNIILPVMAFALVAVAVAIVAEGSLAFLGLSVADPQASWGAMILDGRGLLTEGQPNVALIPAFVMFLTVLCLNLLGDKFRQAFDVRGAAL
jgi:peptide/nickel transport system permease protein